ncbi:MAG TPA: tetratricopeptide repeat protein, partial [Povalibacter sp.]|nr:tetratricopeptide repeat protein [Povalibacter sp.]
TDASLDSASLRRRGAASAGRLDFQAALVDFDRAVELDATDPENFYWRGKARWRMSRLALAEADFDQALRLKPDHVEALIARGTLRLSGDNEAGARTDFDAAQRISSDDSQVLLEIANAFEQSERAGEAITRLDAWVGKHPKDNRLAEVLNNRCWLRATENRELNVALADCDAALKKGPRNSDVYDSRAFVYLRLGNYDKAVDDYDAALKLQPRAADSLYGRGLARLRQGLKEEGSRDIAAAIAMNPDAAKVYEKAGLNP